MLSGYICCQLKVTRLHRLVGELEKNQYKMFRFTSIANKYKKFSYRKQIARQDSWLTCKKIASHLV